MPAIEKQIAHFVKPLILAANRDPRLLIQGIKVEIAQLPLSSQAAESGYCFLKCRKDDREYNMDLFNPGNSNLETLIFKTLQHVRAIQNPSILISPLFGTKIDTSYLPGKYQLDMDPQGVLLLNKQMPCFHKAFSRFDIKDQLGFSSCSVIRAVAVKSGILFADDAAISCKTQFPVIELPNCKWRLSSSDEGILMQGLYPLLNKV